ncbi:unnamed protein product [Meganyctiphanes norvegica]|uniref:Uncharacterized protein n=1 Tax=Meganyctiphanes norvegica TaxID=48144 RepID=A0AAV2PYL6_MEGNR
MACFHMKVDGDWQIGEPMGNGGCLLFGRTSGKYYDYPCNFPLQYVCEWIPDSVCDGSNCSNSSVCVPLKFNDHKCVCSENPSRTPEVGCNHSVKFSAQSSLLLLLLFISYVMPKI